MGIQNDGRVLPGLWAVRGSTRSESVRKHADQLQESDQPWRNLESHPLGEKGCDRSLSVSGFPDHGQNSSDQPTAATLPGARDHGSSGTLYQNATDCL